MSIRYTLRHNIPNELVQLENDKYAAKQQDVNDSSTYDFNLMRKHELAETQSGSVVFRRATGEIVDWARATTLRGEQLVQEMENKKQEILDMITDLSVYVQNAENSIDNATEEAMDSLDDIVDSANQALVSIQDIQDQIEDMIDIEAITSAEINQIVGGA